MGFVTLSVKFAKFRLYFLQYNLNDFAFSKIPGTRFHSTDLKLYKSTKTTPPVENHRRRLSKSQHQALSYNKFGHGNLHTLFFINKVSVSGNNLFERNPTYRYYPARTKGLRAESARAVTGRRCPHSGEGEDFLTIN